MIDWQRVATLRDEVGVDDFADVADLFLEEVDEVIVRLAAPDLTTLAHDLHCVRGSAQGLGFVHFSELCQIGETQCENGQAQSVDVSQIITAYQASKHQFIAELPAFVG